MFHGNVDKPSPITARKKEQKSYANENVHIFEQSFLVTSLKVNIAILLIKIQFRWAMGDEKQHQRPVHPIVFNLIYSRYFVIGKLRKITCWFEIALNYNLSNNDMHNSSDRTTSTK